MRLQPGSQALLKRLRRRSLGELCCDGWFPFSFLLNSPLLALAFKTAQGENAVTAKVFRR